jgi:hypothetical protein
LLNFIDLKNSAEQSPPFCYSYGAAEDTIPYCYRDHRGAVKRAASGELFKVKRRLNVFTELRCTASTVSRTTRSLEHACCGATFAFGLLPLRGLLDSPAPVTMDVDRCICGSFRAMACMSAFHCGH